VVVNAAIAAVAPVAAATTTTPCSPSSSGIIPGCSAAPSPGA